MSRAIILQHAASAAPGRIVPVFRDFGIPTDVRRLYSGDEVPTDLDELRLLVILGGPLSIKDIGSEKYPYLATEISTLQRMINIDRAVLGIGFGAQLLAHAAGAKVFPNAKPPPHVPHGQPPLPPSAEPPQLLPEFGWAPVTFPFPGGTEPMVYGLSDGTPMFHWHHDTFDLPKLPAPANPPPPPAPPPLSGNSLLSSSHLCKNQAFRFRNRLFGFQYHFELTEPDIEAYCEAGRDDLSKVLGPEGVQRVRDDTKKNYPRYSRMGDRILKNFVQFLRAY